VHFVGFYYKNTATRVVLDVRWAFLLLDINEYYHKPTIFL